MTPTPTRSALPRALDAALVLAAAALFAGCSSTPEQTEPLPTSARPMIATPQVASTPEPQRPTYRGPWEDPSSPLYRRTIYFDYDSAEIQPQYLDLIRIHSAYLGKNPRQHVTLDGNTDERGTREYNLALGDRRAESVKQLMLAEGVTAGQMATMSYGEERPADPGHSDNGWRLNRRVIIQY